MSTSYITVGNSTTSIPSIILSIANDIQSSFEELIKLLLRKSLTPLAINGCDNINNYQYQLVNNSIGWTGSSMATFRIIFKYSKQSNLCNRTYERYGSGRLTNLNTIPRVNFGIRAIGVSNNNLGCGGCVKFRQFQKSLCGKNVQNIVLTKNFESPYLSNLYYIDSLTELQEIGTDIINQTDPILTPQQSASMSTNILRAKLYILDTTLGELSVSEPDIYCAYVDMVRLINSIDQSKIIWLTQLIGTLTYQNWTDLTAKQQLLFVDNLGETFIEEFISNKLITILLQSDHSALIIRASYFFTLTKLLFVVFGYQKLTATIDRNIVVSSGAIKNALNKNCVGMTRQRSGIPTGSGCCKQPIVQAPGPETEPDTPCNEACQSIDQCIYDRIMMFFELYPTITEIMGSCETFPAPCDTLNCATIIPSYSQLNTQSEMLWNFNNYAYCIYSDDIDSRCFRLTLNSKVTDKVRYLNTV